MVRENPRVKNSIGSCRFEHEEDLCVPRMSPAVSGLLYLREPPGAPRRADVKCCSLAGAGLASFMEAHRLVSQFGINSPILQDPLLSS